MAEKNRLRTLHIINMILLIIIIILLFFCKCGKTNEEYPVPTGNVDIFNLTVNPDDDSDTEDNGIPAGPTKIPPKKSDDSSPIPGDDGDDPSDPGYFEVSVFEIDENGNAIYWGDVELDIFNNSVFKYWDEARKAYIYKLAPGLSNSYNFVVNNNSKVPLRYSVEIRDEFETTINLKYRLRRNGELIIGKETSDISGWVSADQLVTELKNIGKASHDTFTLDWKWFDDDEHDTYIGKNFANEEYKLNIKIYFEAI